MKEKRAFRRNDAASTPGVLLSGGQRFNITFDNLSLVGARVKAQGDRLPPVGSTAVLRMNDRNGMFQVECKVVGLDGGDFYRLKFDGIGEGSLNNLLVLLQRLGGDGYNPEKELPNLVLEIS